MVCLAGHARADDDRPSTGALVGGGLAMAPVAYLAGVAWHEGSHALWATLFGAEVTEFDVLPGTHDGTFYFGYTRWRGGDLSDGERAWVLVSPKLTDALLLGGFTALVAADALPDNRWSAISLTVLASAAWVDFTLDVFSWRAGNDLVRAHKLMGHTTELQRLPWRLLHLGLAAGAGYVLYRGYVHVFDEEDEGEGMPPTAFVVPLVNLSF